MSLSVVSWTLPVSAGLPLLLACALCIPGMRGWGTRFLIAAPLPALLTALMVIGSGMPMVTLDLKWILIGSRLILDDTGQVFLLLTAIIWLSAAMFSANDSAVVRHRFRFQLCFLLAMVGNITVILAADLASFYGAFALMSFAAYGLIVTNDDTGTVRAGRIYITLVIIGEVLLFSALVAGAKTTGSPFVAQWQLAAPAAVTVPLIMLAFGIKLGVIPWHFVLPVTYRAAPYSAVIALGGAMLNAGLLGWLRFLPLGQVSLPYWGATLIVLGLAASFMGVLLGILQNNPKALLGYSSVSQVGLMTSVVGLALMDHRQWESLYAVLLIYTLHHALAKGALFYAAGFNRARSQRIYYWQCFALVLPALSIAGAPLTTGALAKSSFKAVIAAVPEPWATWFMVLLPLSSVATSMLLSRFIAMSWPKQGSSNDVSNTTLWGQVLLIVSVVAGVWLVADIKELQTLSAAMEISSLLASTWPVFVGVIIVAGADRVLKKFNQSLPLMPPGDIVVPLEAIIRYTLDQLATLTRLIGHAWQQFKFRFPADVATATLQISERTLRSPLSVGILFALIFLGLLLTLGALIRQGL